MQLAIVSCVNNILTNEFCSKNILHEARFLELGGPLSPEALGSLPTLPKVKASPDINIM